MVKRVERAAEAASREEMGHHSQKVGISSLHGGVLSQEDLHSKVLALIPRGPSYMLWRDSQHFEWSVLRRVGLR